MTANKIDLVFLVSLNRNLGLDGSKGGEEPTNLMRQQAERPLRVSHSSHWRCLLVPGGAISERVMQKCLKQGFHKTTGKGVKVGFETPMTLRQWATLSVFNSNAQKMR